MKWDKEKDNITSNSYCHLLKVKDTSSEIEENKIRIKDQCHLLNIFGKIINEIFLILRRWQ